MAAKIDKVFADVLEFSAVMCGVLAVFSNKEPANWVISTLTLLGSAVVLYLFSKFFRHRVRIIKYVKAAVIAAAVTLYKYVIRCVEDV